MEFQFFFKKKNNASFHQNNAFENIINSKKNPKSRYEFKEKEQNKENPVRSNLFCLKDGHEIILNLKTKIMFRYCFSF
jgi:hypothetical protein